MADLVGDSGRDDRRPAEGRSATWLELFFDLIFVINIAGLTHHLVAHPDLDTLGQVTALYLPLFLVWAGHTTYATRFDDGSALQTLLTLLLMFTLAGSALYVQSGLDEHAASFTRTQLGARVVLVLLYLEAHVRVPAARRFTWFLLIGFAVSAVAWGAQEFMAEPWRRPLYLVAIGAELLAPLLAVSGLGRWPAHPSHLPERLGLFTIIVLGEAVLGVVIGGVHAEEARLPFAIGFALPVGIWWFYFRLLDRAELRGRVGGGQILTYVHLPMTLAVVVMAAAVEVSLAALGHVEPDGAGRRGLTGPRMLFAGLAAWLTCFLAMRVHVPGDARPRGGHPPTGCCRVDDRRRRGRAGRRGAPDRTGDDAGAVHLRRGADPGARRPGLAAERAAAAPRCPAITRPLTAQRRRVAGSPTRGGSPSSTASPCPVGAGRTTLPP